MQLKDLKLTHINKRKKRIARGGKKGTTAGRGTKGQKSRTGHNIRPAERDLIKKLPKLRGYRFKSLANKSSVVNVGDLNGKFNSGDAISPELLLEKGLISRINGRMPKVKLLGKGDVKNIFIITGCEVSGSAKSKIEKAGGKITINT